MAYDVFRTLSWGLDIAASVDSGALQQRDSGKEGSQAGGGSAWQYGDSGPMAAVYIGDQQVCVFWWWEQVGCDSTLPVIP